MTAVGTAVLVTVGSRIGGVEMVLVGYAIAAFIPCSLGLIRLLRLPSPGSVPVELVTQFYRFTFFTWMSAVLSVCVWSRIEVFFLKEFLGADSVAMFSVALAYSNLTSLGAMLLAGPMLPHFAALSGTDDRVALNNAYKEALLVIAYVLFPASLGAAALAPQLVPIIYGSRFEPAIVPAMILTTLSILGVSTVASSMVYGMDKPQFIAISGIIGATLSITLLAVVVPTNGILGALVVRSIIQSTSVFAGFYYVWKTLKCEVPVKLMSRIFLAACLCSFVAFSVSRILPSNSFLPLSIAMGAVTYVLTLGLINGLPDDVRLTFIRRVWMSLNAIRVSK